MRSAPMLALLRSLLPPAAPAPAAAGGGALELDLLPWLRSSGGLEPGASVVAVARECYSGS
eukprot:4309245-Pyramimonas_sp.AAC.1